MTTDSVYYLELQIKATLVLERGLTRDAIFMFTVSVCGVIEKFSEKQTLVGFLNESNT